MKKWTYSVFAYRCSYKKLIFSILFGCNFVVPTQDLKYCWKWKNKKFCSQPPYFRSYPSHDAFDFIWKNCKKILLYVFLVLSFSRMLVNNEEGHSDSISASAPPCYFSQQVVWMLIHHYFILELLNLVAVDTRKSQEFKSRNEENYREKIAFPLWCPIIFNCFPVDFSSR